MERTRSPITTETDMDVTAALLPSGGAQSHHHALKTAVSETGPLPAPGCQTPPSPAVCHCGGLAKPPAGAQPGAGCRLWNAPYPKLPPGSCAGKGFGQSTLPFSFGTNAAPPPRAPCLMPSWLGSLPGTGGKPPECWEGPDTRPGLDNGSPPPLAFEKSPIWEGCSPWAEAWPGQAASPAEVRCGLQEGQGGAGAPPDSAVSLPGWPVATETAAELQRDDGFALSKALEQPATHQEGAQRVPPPVSPVRLQGSATAGGGSGQAQRTPAEPEPPRADPQGEELPRKGPGWTEEEVEVRRCRSTEPGRCPGTGSESGHPMSPEPASLGPGGASSPMKTSVEDAYGRLTKACGLSLLEELRRTFLDGDGSCFSLLDSGLVLGRVEEHAALGLALLPMRDGRKLATALPNSSLFLYYALGRQFYVTEKLADCWFRARDRVTGESMLVKKVPVVSDWRKMLHNFLFLPPHPSLLVPYAVLYDRNGSILYLMQDRDVRAVGRPPEGPVVERARALQEVLDFLRYCKHHGFHPGDVGAASIYTAQGVCYDPSSLSSSEDPCAFRKSMKSCLCPLLAQDQELAGLDALVDSMYQDLEEEEVLGHSNARSSQAPGTGLK